MSDEKPLAMTYIVCGVVIEKNGKVLLVQEKQPKAYGKWNLPAGRVDQGETLEQAAIREAKEECGFDVELGGELLVQHASVDRPVLHAYKAKVVGGELAFPKDEMLDARLFTYDEVHKLGRELRNPDYILGAIDASRAS